MDEQAELIEKFWKVLELKECTVLVICLTVTYRDVEVFIGLNKDLY